MKRLLIFLLAVLFTASLQAQNKAEFKKPIHANAGLTVGEEPDSALISSITSNGTDIKFKRGTKILNPYTPGSEANIGWYNILDFGAVPNDGSNSDNEAIQAAIDSAYTFVRATIGLGRPDSCGATVYIPRGKWYIDACDTLRAFVSVIADPGAVFLFPSDYTGCMWTNTRSGYLRETYLEGGFYRLPDSEAADFMRIHVDKNEYYASFNTVRDIKIEHARYCFLMSANLAYEGWANAFTIDNIFVNYSKSFFKAIDMDACNISNINFNCYVGANVTDTIFNIDSNWNIIDHVLIHDADINVVGFYIAEGAIQNDISSGMLPYHNTTGFWDEGSGTIIKGEGAIYSNVFYPTLQADSNLIAGSANIDFHKSKDAVTTAGRYVRANDQLGKITFSGLTAAGYEQAAAITATVYANDPGTGDMPGALNFYTSSDGSASPTLRFMIGSAYGNWSYLNLNPATNGSYSLGEGGRSWSGLYLSATGRVDFGNNDVYLLGSANKITLVGGNLEFKENTTEIFITTNTGNIVAETGITTAMLSSTMLYNGSSAIDITANPQIVDGYDGQEITIVGSSDTNKLTLDDGNGLHLNAQCVLGLGDLITLRYIQAIDLWCQKK